MPERPIIGVTTQTLESRPDLPRCWVMSQRYVQVLTAVGAIPWVIPLLQPDEATMRAIYERVAGVFFPGGVDIDPATYGEAAAPVCGRTDPARDWTELRLARWAIADHKPIFAVCRGVQLLNVAVGGTLYQDIASQVPAAIKHDNFPSGGHGRDELSHDVRLTPGSRLARLLETETLAVNSMHHQGIARLAPPLEAVAVSADGLIEGVESGNDQFVVGVQWHPEDLVDRDPRMRSLFSAFIAAARSFRP